MKSSSVDRGPDSGKDKAWEAGIQDLFAMELDLVALSLVILDGFKSIKVITLWRKYLAKNGAETDLLQNMKGSFDKENTNATVRLEYKVPILKQKTYDKRQC